MISRFFIRFTDRTTKIGVSISIQTKLNRIEISIIPRAKDLVTITALLSGKKICATICSNSGMDDNGKKVPLKRNIGVIKRNPG